MDLYNNELSNFQNKILEEAWSITVANIMTTLTNIWLNEFVKPVVQYLSTNKQNHAVVSI